MPFAGKKTYALGAALISYIVVAKLSPDVPPLDMDLIAAALGAMGITIRMGVKNGK